MNFIEELSWRGLIQDQSPGLEDLIQQKQITAYIGFDPTAPSLTLGNLVSVMLLKHLQLHGHRPIVVMGGATGKIGDPSGKDQERQLLSYDSIQQNIEAQKKQFEQLLEFEGDTAAMLIDNATFYDTMDIFTFLRDIGKNITVNYMLSKDSVKNRMENGISFTEFSYQLIQGYDFQYLYQNHDCQLQMGGSDQWGNITSGTHFIAKNGGKGYGLTCPLLTKSDGKKFGKSEKGNVWLDPAMTSPFQFYQFWLGSGINDDDLPKLFKTFSLKSKETIEGLLTDHQDDPRELRKILAEEMCTRIHSKEAFDGARSATNILFSRKLNKEMLDDLSPSVFTMLSEELPGFEIKASDLESGITIDNLLVNQHESLQSKSDVRRAIKGSALSINTQKVTTIEQTIGIKDLYYEKYILFQNGKKHKFIGVLES